MTKKTGLLDVDHFNYSRLVSDSNKRPSSMVDVHVRMVPDWRWAEGAPFSLVCSTYLSQHCALVGVPCSVHPQDPVIICQAKHVFLAICAHTPYTLSTIVQFRHFGREAIRCIHNVHTPCAPGHQPHLSRSVLNRCRWPTFGRDCGTHTHQADACVGDDPKTGLSLKSSSPCSWKRPFL